MQGRTADLLLGLLTVLGIAAHLVFLISLRTGVLDRALNDSVHRFGPGCDFFSIYAAGVKARVGESVYTIGGHVEQVPYAYAFRYAPLVAYTLGLALSWLPHLTAYGVWLCLCELALLRNIRLTWELAHHEPARTGDTETGREEWPSCRWVRQSLAHPYTLTALWLLFSPYYLELYVGQFTFITASLVFWAYLGWQRCSPRRHGDTERLQGLPTTRDSYPLLSVSPCLRGEFKADLFWAAAVWLKMMPLLYLPIALLRGRWKSAAATVAVLGVTSWVYFQRFPGDWKVFTDTNADPRPTWHAGNQGLMALLYALSGEHVGVYLQYRLVALAVVGMLLLWLTYRAWQAERQPAQASPTLQHSSTPLLHLYALASAAYLLLYKDVWEHHYVLLLPPLVLLALRRESPWVWLPPFLVSALPTLFALYDVPGLGYNEDPQHYWLPTVSLLHHAWKPVAPLWLAGALGVQAFRLAGRHHGDTETRREMRGEVGVGETTDRSRPGCSPVLTPRSRSARLSRIAVPLSLALSLVVITPCLCVSVVHTIQAQRRVTREVVWPAGVFRRQERPETCGPAALAAVCRHYGQAAEEAELARLAGTTRRGTSMLGLQRAAQARGLAAEARQVTPDELRALPRPSLLFFHQGHFAVLTGVQGDHFYVADPSLGQRVWPAAYLRRYWHGEVLLLGPGEPR
jgi:hypothetical protein